MRDHAESAICEIVAQRAEMFRVLAPGGRIRVSDVVAEDHVTPQQRAECGSYVGSVAGALSLTDSLG